MTRQPEEDDLVDQVARAIAGGVDNTNPQQWAEQGAQYRIEMRQGAQAALDLLRGLGWTYIGPPQAATTPTQDQLETLKAAAARYNLPNLERRITALEEQVGSPGARTDGDLGPA